MKYNISKLIQFFRRWKIRKSLIVIIICFLFLLLVVIGIYMYRKSNDTSIPKDAKCVAEIYQGKEKKSKL